MRKPWNRGGLRSYLILLGLFAGKATISSILLGVPFLIAGIALHLWAKGCLHQNQEVTTSGPYRFVRHPFYLGNALIDSSIVIMSGWLLLMCITPLWWLAIYLRTMRREESAMETFFDEDYKAYARRVPMFLPTTHPISAKPGFSWQNLNILPTEIPRALRFLSYPFLFLVSYEIHTEGLFLSSFMNPLIFNSLLIVLLLNGLALQLRKVVRGQDILHLRWLSQADVRISLLVAFALVGSLMTYSEVEADYVLIPFGLFVIAVSFFSYLRKPQEAIVLELVSMIGASFLFEVPWLAVAPLFLCAGNLIATRFSPLVSHRASRGLRVSPIPCGRIGFLLFLIICVCLSATKEALL